MAEREKNESKVLKILIVDDEPGIRITIKRFLENDGYIVTDADCGETALIAIDESPPNIVLLDIRMPGMDGITCLKHIKDSNPDIQVVMVSGFATTNVAKQSLEIGAFDYISKPLNFNHLKNVIQQIKLSRYLDNI